MSRRIELNPARISERSEMKEYMKEVFRFKEDSDCSNLDALRDSLSEVTEDTEVVLYPSTITAICADDYAYKTLMAIGYACNDNPHIQIRFRQEKK